MKTIVRAATDLTPAINFDASKGFIYIKGRSIPEHTVEFYRGLHEWLDEYAKYPHPKTTVSVQLEYYNTASTKCLMEIFRKLEAIHKKGHEMELNWYYEEDDEDMCETGEDMSALIDIPFKIIAVPIE